MHTMIDEVSISGLANEELSLPVVIQANSRRLDIVKWIRENRSYIDDALVKYGGILFRKFRINGIAHFERIMTEPFEQPLLSYDNRSTPRTSVKGNVYTSTEYPHEQMIPLHNENSYTRSWAKKIFFYCIKPSNKGGQTPIADSRLVLNKIPDNIIDKFNQFGLLYVRNYSGLDLPWQDVFQTNDKYEVERYCQSQHIEYEWLEDNHLRTRQLCQAVVQHPVTQELVWFNQAHLFHISNLKDDIRSALLENFDKENLPRNVYFGDGSEIDTDDLAIIRLAYESETISFPWISGDILLLDNMLSAHGRLPFEGQRKVVVGMIEPYINNEISITF